MPMDDSFDNVFEAGLAEREEDIPVYYDLDERDSDAIACNIVAYSGDHCGGNTGGPLGIPTNNKDQASMHA
ncbi:uncharacterized protein LTR77_007141 [Saxophila tyrrhenica]|uniref:Uncharacterized protein n=1 Tax=Saxophila tyrrhenica TaxID=1690608 RepID=A0AAV9P4C4_9PEZI|nr:hypothetical protein LTR77_007141 [Saxophila tyrrhenica]